MAGPWLRFLGVLLLALALTLPASAQPSGPAVDRETVVYAVPDTFRGSLSPFLALVLDLQSSIFTVDVDFDSQGRPFAQGVEYLPSIRDGTWKVDGERMVLTWKIRARKWHDGRPVTCGDYVFSHTVARDEQISEGMSRNFIPFISVREALGRARKHTNMIASASCPQGAGGNEVTVTWNAWYPYANWLVVEYGPLPRHIFEPIYRQSPPALLRSPGFEAASTIGDGAYRVVEVRKEESLTLQAVPNHSIFGTPKIKRLIYRHFRGPDEALSALLEGSIDIVTLGFGITLERARRLGPEIRRGNIRLLFSQDVVTETLAFNLDNPLLQEVRVRRAIAHGINRTQMVQQLFGGMQPVAHSYLPRYHIGYTEDVQRYPHDPARARALLRAAGFAAGPDGIMRSTDGRRLALEITTTAGDRTRERVEDILQEQLRQIGVDLVIVNYPGRVFFSEIINRRQFKGLAMFGWILGPDQGCLDRYTSDGIPTEANRWQGRNLTGYRNAEMDGICREAFRDTDDARQKQLYSRSARILARDLPELPLYYRVRMTAVRSGLQNLSAGANSLTWNAHTWYWR